MIKSLQIKNFLSHKHTDIEFSPGVNIIVGPTDSGKSAIIRALRWVISNRPTGDSFRSSWGGDTEVLLELDDNIVVRGKGDANFYELNGDEFKAFGADVPAEIKKALNLNEINLQTQFESHFLLSRSAGEVASHFNKVAHLDTIDIGLQNIQRWLKKIQQSIVTNDAQIEEYTEQLSEYDSLEQIEKLIKEVEGIELKQEEGVSKVEQIQFLSKSITSINEEIRILEITASKEVLVTKALSILEEQGSIVERLISLQKACKSISEVNQTISDLAELLPIEKLVNRALEIDKEIRDVKYIAFTNLVNSIMRVDERMSLTEVGLGEMEHEFHENMEVCPLCETILK